jgi:hypothetical protein
MSSRRFCQWDVADAGLPLKGDNQVVSNWATLSGYRTKTSWRGNQHQVINTLYRGLGILPSDLHYISGSLRMIRQHRAMKLSPIINSKRKIIEQCMV